MEHHGTSWNIIKHQGHHGHWGHQGHHGRYSHHGHQGHHGHYSPQGQLLLICIQISKDKTIYIGKNTPNLKKWLACGRIIAHYH